MHTSLLVFDVQSWLCSISTPGRSHSWSPCAKARMGEGADLPLSQMWIPQLKWKIHILHLIRAQRRHPSISQSWVNWTSWVQILALSLLRDLIQSDFPEFSKLNLHSRVNFLYLKSCCRCTNEQHGKSL